MEFLKRVCLFIAAFVAAVALVVADDRMAFRYGTEAALDGSGFAREVASHLRWAAEEGPSDRKNTRQTTALYGIILR